MGLSKAASEEGRGALYLFFTLFVYEHYGPAHQIVELTEQETRCLVTTPRADVFEFEPGTARPIHLERDVTATLETARQLGVAPRLRVIIDPYEVRTEKQAQKLAEQRVEVLREEFVVQGTRPPEVETLVEFGPRRLVSLGQGARLGRVEAWPDRTPRPPGLVWLSGPGLPPEELQRWLEQAHAEEPAPVEAGLHAAEAHIELGDGRQRERRTVDPDGPLAQALLAWIEQGCQPWARG
jgi:hypothetical protein